MIGKSKLLLKVLQEATSVPMCNLVVFVNNSVAVSKINTEVAIQHVNVQ